MRCNNSKFSPACAHSRTSNKKNHNQICGQTIETRRLKKQIFSILTLQKNYVWYGVVGSNHNFLNTFLSICTFTFLAFARNTTLIYSWIFLVHFCEMFPISMEWKNNFRRQKYLRGLPLLDCWRCYCYFRCCLFHTYSIAFSFVLFSHSKEHGFTHKKWIENTEKRQKWQNIESRK